MHVFEIVIALLVGGAVLAAFARRIGTPYPALVALAGAAVAIVPGTPELVLDPELALALFVAPILVDAAFDASPRDLWGQSPCGCRPRPGRGAADDLGGRDCRQGAGARHAVAGRGRARRHRRAA
jgi:hypothetical protein